jgi:hypothetical protein
MGEIVALASQGLVESNKVLVVCYVLGLETRPTSFAGASRQSGSNNGMIKTKTGRNELL